MLLFWSLSQYGLSVSSQLDPKLTDYILYTLVSFRIFRSKWIVFYPSIFFFFSFHSLLEKFPAEHWDKEKRKIALSAEHQVTHNSVFISNTYISLGTNWSTLEYGWGLYSNNSSSPEEITPTVWWFSVSVGSLIQIQKSKTWKLFQLFRPLEFEILALMIQVYDYISSYRNVT